MPDDIKFTLDAATAYQESAGEQYMNPKQLDHFDNILKTWKAQLMLATQQMQSSLQKETGQYADLSDRATHEESFNASLSAQKREYQLIQSIDDAIAKITRKEYGYCDVCGIEIGLKRLEARPTALLCIDCKTLAEYKERSGS